MAFCLQTEPESSISQGQTGLELDVPSLQLQHDPSSSSVGTIKPADKVKVILPIAKDS